MTKSGDEQHLRFPIGALLDGGRWRVTEIPAITRGSLWRRIIPSTPTKILRSGGAEEFAGEEAEEFAWAFE